MRLAAVHDAEFAREDGVYYCNIIDYNMLKTFLRHFDKITVVGRSGKRLPEFVKIDLPGVEVHTVRAITRPIKFVFDFFKIYHNIKNIVQKSDVVYCRGMNGMLAQKAALKCGVPAITYVGGCIYESMKNNGSRYMRMLARPAMLSMKQSILKSDYVIYCCEYLKKKYRTMGNALIWSAIIVKKADEQLLRMRQERIKRSKDEIIIGVIGHVHNKIKGMDTAVKALSSLDEKFTLRILGGGDRTALNEQIQSLGFQNRVCFSGVLSDPDRVFMWLDDIDIYIQPSRTEGLPKATIEAMSRGCPVISSNAGGLPDLVKNEFLHNPEDFGEMARLIQKLADDEALMMEMSDYSLKKSEEFLLDIMNEKIDGLFKDVITQIKNLKKARDYD